MAAEGSAEETPAEVLARSSEKIADACSADLTALLGREVSLTASGVQRVSAERVVADDSPIAHQLCRASGELDADVHVLIPRPDAARLAALQLGNEDDPPDAPNPTHRHSHDDEPEFSTASWIAMLCALR